MASTLIQQAFVVQAQGTTTRNLSCCSGGGNLVTTELNVQRVERTGGVYFGLYVRVSTNASDNTTTYRFRKNTANGNQNVSFAAAETGVKQDVTNNDSVAVTDVVNFQSINTGTGTISITGITCGFSANADTVQHYNFNVTAVPTSAATTNYFSLAGDQSSTVQADNETKVGTAGTYKNLGVRVTVNTIDVTGSSTFVFLINGAAGTVTVTFASGETGLKEDTTHSDAVVLDDLVCIRQVNTGVAGAITTAIGWISSQTTNNKTDYVAVGRSTRIVAQTRYFEFVGNNGGNSTETGTQFIAQVASTLSNARAYVSANTWTGSFNVVLRKNTADANSTILFATTVTGWVHDAVNTDLVVAQDLMSWRNTTNAGSGSITIQNMVITATMATSAGGNLLRMGCG